LPIKNELNSGGKNYVCPDQYGESIGFSVFAANSAIGIPYDYPCVKVINVLIFGCRYISISVCLGISPYIIYILGIYFDGTFSDDLKAVILYSISYRAKTPGNPIEVFNTNATSLFPTNV